MKRHAHVVLVATLVSSAAWSQEVSVYGTTVAQFWRDAPGLDRTSYSPGDLFLGIDATNVGHEGLSLHLFGWFHRDLGEGNPSDPTGESNLAYGYFRYRFSKANAEIKAGRFTVNQGVGMEQVDGVSARADLIGGFTVSAFGGQPVAFKTVDPKTQRDYAFQRDFIFGTRLGWRAAKYGEFGLSFLQDGSTPAKDLPVPSPTDYTRKQLGFDLRLSPLPALELSGRTVYDLASRPDTDQGSPSRIAEHDYTLAYRFAPRMTLSGTYTERNLQAFFAGSNLPSLFRQIEKDKHRAHGLSFAWNPTASVDVVADYRSTDRETYGKANRFGGEVRWNVSRLKLVSGLGYHRLSADDVKMAAGSGVPAYSLSHGEIRAWVMYDGEKLTASLDGIHHSYDDKKNPLLNGQTSVLELVGSAGYKATANLRFSGDLGYGVNPFFKKEVRALLRAEFRFGFTGKGVTK